MILSAVKRYLIDSERVATENVVVVSITVLILILAKIAGLLLKHPPQTFSLSNAGDGFSVEVIGAAPLAIEKLYLLLKAT